MKVCIYHSFFCNVLIQLQIALQGRIKNKHGNYVEVDLTYVFSIFNSVL